MRKIKKIVIYLFLHFLLNGFQFASKSIAIIQGGNDNCSVLQKSNNKQEPAYKNMRLYEGDRIYKSNGIRKIIIKFMKNAELKFIDNTSGIISFKSNNYRKTLFSYLDLEKKEWQKVELATRKLNQFTPNCFLNPSVLYGEKLLLDIPANNDLITFREIGNRKVIFEHMLHNGDIFETTSGIDLQPNRYFIADVSKNGRSTFRSNIRLLDKSTSSYIENRLKKFENENLSKQEILMEKASFLILYSLNNAENVDLFMLSSRFLTEPKLESRAVCDVQSSLDALNKFHISAPLCPMDFSMLRAVNPACVLTIELNRDGKKSYVPPNYLFKENDRISFQFLTRFEGRPLLFYKGKTFLPINLIQVNNQDQQFSAYKSKICIIDPIPEKSEFIVILPDQKSDLLSNRQIESIFLRKDPQKVNLFGNKAFIKFIESSHQYIFFKIFIDSRDQWLY